VSGAGRPEARTARSVAARTEARTARSVAGRPEARTGRSAAAPVGSAAHPERRPVPDGSCARG